jgi:hypothetical protein
MVLCFRSKFTSAVYTKWSYASVDEATSAVCTKWIYASVDSYIRSMHHFTKWSYASVDEATSAVCTIVCTIFVATG